MLYGGSKINTHVFDWLSNSYYIDNDEKDQKLFIKEKQDSACWITFSRAEEKIEKQAPKELNPILGSYKRVNQEPIKFSGNAGHPDLRAIFGSLDEAKLIRTPHMMLRTTKLQRIAEQAHEYSEKIAEEEFNQEIDECIFKITEA